MFPTFTGSSRRPRNVNLSGQRNTNPWSASSSWSPSTSGASQTVAHAQAERERRQKERDELVAAKRLQRAWRGHQARKNDRAKYRQEYDTLYNHLSDVCVRISSGLPLLLVFFEPSLQEDQDRLDLLICDLGELQSRAEWDIYPSSLWNRLVRLLVAALERHVSFRLAVDLTNGALY